jgi:prepilin-type N-terminal cleavage/methylation domain-containing protein
MLAGRLAFTISAVGSAASAKRPYHQDGFAGRFWANIHPMAIYRFSLSKNTGSLKLRYLRQRPYLRSVMKSPNKSVLAQGFSLVELLVVIAVIAVIAAIAIPNISDITGGAQEAKDRRNAQNIASVAAAARAVGITVADVPALIAGVTTNVGGQPVTFRVDGISTNAGGDGYTNYLSSTLTYTNN